MSKINLGCALFQVESEFLSNEETKQRLPSIMGQLLTELNSTGACSIQIGVYVLLCNLIIHHVVCFGDTSSHVNK